MSLIRIVTLSVAGALLAAPLLGQGIPPRRSGAATVARNAPRVLVANPYVFAAADSAAAVQVGDGMRERMDDVTGRDYQVIPDTVMNSALVQFGYPEDAILTPLLARTLAQNIQGRFVVTSTMTKDQGGRYHVTARLTGVNDDAGQVVSAIQESGQKLDAFGAEIANEFEPAVEALEDARQCVSQMQENPDKAADAAEKALEKVPNHGLASYCLAQLAVARKAPREEVVKHLQQAVKGDSLSLPAWTLLAQQYQAANDTSQMFYAFENMLRVAPTNQKLREELLRQFLNAGEIDRAKRVADEGLKLDPYNADLYDLKSNVCLFASDFPCAIDALEQAYTVDSTRADTLFFTKISVAAAQQPDTARLLKWSQLGVQKFPENVTLLGYYNQGLALSGQTDSSLAVTRRLLTLDTTAVAPALAAVQALAGDTTARGDSTIRAQRLQQMQEFVGFVEQRGDPTQREQLAVILVNSALPLLQEPQDLETAAALARQSVALADPNGKLAPSANYVLGLATFLQAAKLDAQTEKQKSCTLARQEDALLKEAEAALQKGQAAKPDVVAQYQGYITKFKPRTASMLKAYCK